jgi:hypothetical protein
MNVTKLYLRDLSTSGFWLKARSEGAKWGLTIQISGGAYNPNMQFSLIFVFGSNLIYL